MKKTKIIIAAVFMIIIVSALSVASFAKWWDGNPFDDVSSDAWYYDAVRITKENGLFNGVSKTVFGVNDGMNRAMFVTVLAAASDYDPSQHTGTPFVDVAEGKYFTAPVAWAYGTGVTSGTGAGTFSPYSVITREELVTMMRKYAALSGYDVSAGNADISAFPDSTDASPWAMQSLKWAYYKGIIAGVAEGDDVILAPKQTATRAQVAQMMVKLLATKPVRQINGNDMSKYVIIYAENAINSVKESAGLLADYIKTSLGLELPVVTDSAAPADYEILVGKTNREDAGLVRVDRDSFEDQQQFECSVQGDRLVISGIDSSSKQDSGDRSTMNINGTSSAVGYFAEEVLGMDFYTVPGTVCSPDPVISLEDGWVYRDGPAFETRIMYTHSGEDAEHMGAGYIYDEWCCGMPHQLGNLIIGDMGNYAHNTWENPCFSDPDNIASLIKNVRYVIEQKPSRNCLGLIQNDSDSYCMCARCREIYREEGSRSGTLIRMLNQVCEAIEDDYPNVKILTWAYTWSAKPPQMSKLHKNIIMVYNTLVLCPSHAYNDPTCKINQEGVEYLTQWRELAEKMLLWDHTGAFNRAMTPFPDWDSILVNAKHFYDYNIRGSFVNGMSSLTVDFPELRTYLFEMSYRNPNMSEEEYYYHMNEFLRAYYGSGWKNLREYLDTLTELANHTHHVFHAPTAAYYNYDEVAAVSDKIDALWDAAEAGADTEKQLERIQLQRWSWVYLKQSAIHDKVFDSGTEEEREEYRATNAALAEAIHDYHIKFTESEGVRYYSAESAPDTW